MKKLTALLLALALLIMLPAGCGSGNTPRNRYEFYYLTDDQAGELSSLKVDSETRYVEANSPLTILQTYIQGPESGSLTSPYPPQTQLLSYSGGDGSAKLRMSSEFFQLSGADRTLAEACLTMTVCQLTGAETVQIIDLDGQITTTDAQMYLLEEDSNVVADDTITLYFADSGSQYLVPENRKLVSGAGVSDERYIIQELIKGPDSEELSPVMPRGTQLLSVETDVNGLCTVDFSAEFMENRPETERQELITIYAIVNSLSSLESVTGVKITIEGKQTEIYRYMELSRVLTAYDGIIGPVRSGMNEMGVSLYMKSWSPDYLAGLPEIIKRRVNITTEEQLLQLLISFDPPEGFSNPIPKGTDINSVSVTDGNCVVDLSEDFLTVNSKDASVQRLSALSIAATLCQLEYIDTVRILVDGESAVLSGYDISQPITIADDIFFP